jgi:signal transduction histidine kinase
VNPKEVTALVHLLGFLTGVALYAMLLAMVWSATRPQSGRRQGFYSQRLLLATAILGLWWNISALVIYGLQDWGLGHPYPLAGAAAFTALGFLPAVVVHSTLRAQTAGAQWRSARWIAGLAYSLSAAAALMHFYALRTADEVPSRLALQLLTFGFGTLILILALYTRRQPGWQRALWAVALAVFAVSALHLSHRHSGAESWLSELIGHHASLPLALAILYQDYRFALADIFLKRALALMILAALAFGLYVVVVAPLLLIRDAQGQLDRGAMGVLLGVWMSTALSYPALRRAAAWFVDVVVLRRTDYNELRVEIARIIAAGEDPETILTQVCARLAPVLSASEVRWIKAGPAETEGALVPSGRQERNNEDEPRRGPTSGKRVDVLSVLRDLRGSFSEEKRVLTSVAPPPTATVMVATTDPPRYLLLIGELAGGRRLLSDDIAMLESVGLMVARRIDAVRVMQERFARSLREQEISKLATEAELRALRAQLNPHFLFNALTTIGHLIQTAPERALDTLMRLTDLLRAVLRRSCGEFITLGEEIDLIESYLAIERARFEERLRVKIELPASLRALPFPPLLLQPLVENAIKHGIAPAKSGGEVIISARLEAEEKFLRITVQDSGAGVSESLLAHQRQRGVGLSNVEQRLKSYWGEAASLTISGAPGQGTKVEIKLPVSSQDEAIAAYAAASAERR